MNKGIFVSGIGTEVGKTVVSAILVEALQADYWKPVQSGDLDYTDTDKIRAWTSFDVRTHPESYRLHTPASPHASAAIDGVTIRLESFQLPGTDNFLVAEGAGGLLVPLNDRHLIIDLIEYLALLVVLVSRHYLGSINHTLLSIEALQRRGIPVAALIFNGDPYTSTEQAIEQFGEIPGLLNMPDLPAIDREPIARVAVELAPAIKKLRG